mmetsp:Transcript_8331/g.10834  ORF Transcript_8331/g.10834 Transcript_8331/m.10834 type:complete len:338 (-) Transcript_8331:648-1661(-)
MAVKLESFEEDALYPRMQSDINMNQSHHNFQADFRNHLAVDSSISSYHSNMSHQKYLKTKERNRIHARKSRERQKNLINTLQTEMGMLQKEFHRLRGLVMGNNLTPLSELDVEGDGEISLGDDKAMEIFTLQGDYTLPNPQPDSGMIDAHKLRKERNRIHAKKTRDRKKNFITNANTVIFRLGIKIRRLKSYLESKGIQVVLEREVEVVLDNSSQTKSAKRVTHAPLPNKGSKRRRQTVNQTSAASISVSPTAVSFKTPKLEQCDSLTPDLTITALLLSQMKRGNSTSFFSNCFQNENRESVLPNEKPAVHNQISKYDFFSRQPFKTENVDSTALAV